MVDIDGVVVLAILDAVLVAVFFLFRVLPWSEPGPWRLIWILATLSATLFSLGEAWAMIQGGTAVSFEVQAPLFGAILAMTACFILVYMHGARISEHALTLANTDDLTQLPNGRAFDERLAAQLRRSDDFGLAYVNLDGLGAVNDMLGRHRGDMLLTGFARILRESVSADDAVARLNGDNFAMMLIGSTARMLAVTELVRESLRTFAIRELSGMEIAALIGVVRGAEASDPQRLMQLAYRAMREAERAHAAG